MPKKPNKEQETEKRIQELEDKLQAVLLATQPKVAPKPIFVVEDLPNMDMPDLKLLLADVIINAWTKVTLRGENSRQLNVFNALNSMIVQELLKAILDKK